MPPRLMLASSSPFRKQLLHNAGIRFDAESARINEREIEATLAGSGAGPEDVAMILAEAKALDVTLRHPEDLVIGSDQTLSLGDEIFHKPENMDAARRHLLRLSGKTHELNSAVVLAINGTAVWRHVSVARMTMRNLDPAFIGRYLARIGDKALGSVGAYQLEAEGIHLFESVEGDYFTILGLPMLPLLKELRKRNAIDG